MARKREHASVRHSEPSFCSLCRCSVAASSCTSMRTLQVGHLLACRRGMSVSLATLTLAVMRRLGVSATLRFVEAEHFDMATLASVGQLATAPEATRILICGGDAHEPGVFARAVSQGAALGQLFLRMRVAVRILGCCASAGLMPRAALSTEACAVLLDLTRKRGTSWLVHGTEAALMCGPSEWDASAVFRMWAEHARTMIVACQRRGESDDVVSWMYQHAALDPEHADFPGTS